MMTDAMTLTTRRDATQWANNMGDFEADEAERLADWIWANKPHVDCDYIDHPVRELDTDALLVIAAGGA